MNMALNTLFTAFTNSSLGITNAAASCGLHKAEHGKIAALLKTIMVATATFQLASLVSPLAMIHTVAFGFVATWEVGSNTDNRRSNLEEIILVAAGVTSIACAAIATANISPFAAATLAFGLASIHILAPKYFSQTQYL